MTSKKPTAPSTKPAQPSKPAPTKAPVSVPAKPSSTKPTAASSNPMKPIQNLASISKVPPKKNVWTNKKGEEYDGNQDYEQPQLEDDTNYFEKQLQKEIETDIKKNMKSEQAGKTGTTGVKAKKEEEKEDPALKNTKVMEK